VSCTWNILGAGEVIGRFLEDTAKGATSTKRQFYTKDHLGSIRGTDRLTENIELTEA
jgi:hypothetical protein